MSAASSPESIKWVQHPKWMFVSGSCIAAVLALAAEGPGFYFIGLGILSLSVAIVCGWALTARVPLEVAAIAVPALMVLLGWTVQEPESSLFQMVILAAAVGWKIERLAVSVGFMCIMAIAPLVGVLGPNDANWGWWNWTIGTAFTWTMGRVIRLLELTLTELTNARGKLIKIAAMEERRRISRDVHDLVGHSLTAMLLNVRAARRTQKVDPAETEKALADAEKIGVRGIADIRAAMVELRRDISSGEQEAEARVSLPDGETIQQMLDRQIHIEIETSGAIDQLQGTLAVTVYRILQECITNIARHSATGRGEVQVIVDSMWVSLCSQNPALDSAKHARLSENTLGLISMRERVTNLGGSFKAEVDSGVWTLHCKIPRYD